MLSLAKGDPLALSEALRSAERKGDYSAAINALACMVACGEWRAVWETAERWYELAMNGNGEPRSRVFFDSKMAARAANAFRLLAPVAGKISCMPAGTGQLPRTVRGAELWAVPHPLPRYVEALRLWGADGWWEWFSVWASCIPGALVTSSADSFVYLSPTIRVHKDGSVIHASTCPPLPRVPIPESKR